MDGLGRTNLLDPCQIYTSRRNVRISEHTFQGEPVLSFERDANRCLDPSGLSSVHHVHVSEAMLEAVPSGRSRVRFSFRADFFSDGFYGFRTETHTAKTNVEEAYEGCIA